MYETNYDWFMAAGRPLAVGGTGGGGGGGGMEICCKLIVTTNAVESLFVYAQSL